MALVLPCLPFFPDTSHEVFPVGSTKTSDILTEKDLSVYFHIREDDKVNSDSMYLNHQTLG